ncbi:glycosyltransferase family protein [Maribacter dokdonensis]|uniref:hypothetical protein n=1 Tax=Maribacter dokdonensis TaxID=320912 RepID=UPI002AB2D308|nr:hypothetical protein [Maribacter dokdonensis]
MKVLISHPTSNQNNRAVAQSIQKANLLYQFHTSIASFPNTFLYKLSKINLLKEVKRREFNASLRAFTHAHPWLELGRLACTKFGFQKLYESENSLFSVDEVYKNIDNKIAHIINKNTSHDISIVYGYEDGAYESFQAAKKKGISCFYELPIAYWEKREQLMTQEIERLPEWEQTWKGGLTDSNEKLKRKTKELQLADTIIVPSRFVKDSLPAWAKEKRIITVPFGTPPIPSKIDSDEKNNIEKPLRVLFVGSMSQRKGLGDLLKL